MSVGSDLLERLRRGLRDDGAARVRALHLPPPTAAGKDAEFCALELDDGSLGLSYVLLEGTPGRLADLADASLAGRDAFEVASWFAVERSVHRTIGFAAINALTRSFFDRRGYRPPPSADSIGMLEPGPSDRVGMVGLFPPLVDGIVRTGAELIVVELRRDLAGPRGGFRVTLDAGELAGCNKILCTSTVLLNDTLEALLAHGRAAQRFVLIGPGASCLPDPLFERGVTAMAGVLIEDGPRFAAALAAGASWGRFARKFSIERAGYPGCAALAGD